MTLNVFIQPIPEKGYLARVLGWPDFVVEGKTKEHVLENIKMELAHRLAEGEIVRLDYEPKNGTHPWMKFAGMWKDDPMFEDVLEEIKTYRQELDNESNE